MPRRRFRFRLLVKDEYQPLSVIPVALWLLLVFMLAAQLAFHHFSEEARADVRKFHLSVPPPEGVLQAAAFGDGPALARLLMLNLQGFDNQQGRSLSFRELDYGRLGEWLDRIVALDERSEYPHFSAAKIYTNVADDGRRRTIIEWVRRHFRDEPDVRWEWMAHAANFAQHVMKDQSLAISMARELREKTTPGAVPGWARQMEVFLLENKNEYEAAASLLFNLLQAGEVTEPIEFSFLLGRLEGMAKTMIERGEVRTPEEIDKIEARLDQLKGMFVAQFDSPYENPLEDESGG